MDKQERCTIILEQASGKRPQLGSILEPGKAIETHPVKGEDSSRAMAQEMGRQPKLALLTSQMLQSERR